MKLFLAAVMSAAVMCGGCSGNSLGHLPKRESVWNTLEEGEEDAAAANSSSNATSEFKEINFILFSSDGNSSIGVDNAPTLLDDATFNRSLRTVFFIHGYMDSKDSDSSKTVSSAFLRQGSFNVIVVDWSAYSGFPYLSALSNLPGASRAVADALNRMVQTGLPAESIWLTGHSLGAQLIGVASDTITFQIHQITGMDPAGPGFETPGVARLTRDAAELVEIVHTDAGVFGFNAPCGDVDIWPNGGTAVQPGCFLELEIGCSHLRSWMYFAEAVNHADAFPAVRCASWDDFRRGACPANGGDVVYMAHSHPGQNQTGNFYLTTNRASPFGKGQQGVTINA